MFNKENFKTTLNSLRLGLNLLWVVNIFIFLIFFILSISKLYYIKNLIYSIICISFISILNILTHKFKLKKLIFILSIFIIFWIGVYFFIKYTYLNILYGAYNNIGMYWLRMLLYNVIVEIIFFILEAYNNGLQG